MLRQVAGVLRDVAAGKGDVLRYSGDDFVTVFFKATEEELSEIQKELILQAADMLRPGGLMLYSTCTFAPAERRTKLFPGFWKTVLTWNWQKWKIMRASPMEFLNGETEILNLSNASGFSHTK